MKGVVYLGVGAALVLFFLVVFLGGNSDLPADETQNVENADSFSPNTIIPEKINFETYNYDFVDENVKGILNNMLGSSGKTAFYLPSSGYINVSRGSKYGVAYALNNPNPSGENYFEYEWTVDESVVQSCGVSVSQAQEWIERGWMSWGKIGEGWIDHMTVYFSFPLDIEPCNVKYNFVINKDEIFYDSKTLEFNLI